MENQTCSLALLQQDLDHGIRIRSFGLMKKLNLLVLIAALLSGCGGEKDSKSNKGSSSDPKPENMKEVIEAVIDEFTALNKTLDKVEDQESAENQLSKVESHVKKLEKLKELGNEMEDDLTDEEKEELVKIGMDMFEARQNLLINVQRLSTSRFGQDIADIVKDMM